MNSAINMKAEHEKVWGECLAIIKDILPPQVFDVWFVPIRPLSIEDKMLTLLLPSSYFYEMLEDRYCDLLFMVLNRVIGTGAKLNYRVMMTNSGDAPTLVDQSGGRRQNAGQGQTVFNPFQGLPSKKIDSQLNHNYTFANSTTYPFTLSDGIYTSTNKSHTSSATATITKRSQTINIIWTSTTL